MLTPNRLRFFGAFVFLGALQLFAQQTPNSIANGLFRSPAYHFTYKIPFAWVDRTAELKQDTESGDKSELLLAIFERPPAVAGNTINSAVIFAVENSASYPGVKTAADYLSVLAELNKTKGFTAVNEPYQSVVGGKTLLRQDFNKDVGKLKMCQSMLVFMTKNNLVSFTFIAGSEEDIAELMENLKFSAAK